MKTSVRVLASHSLLHSIGRDDTQLPNLKQQIIDLCGSRIRRVDRFIELCLLGALRCVGERQLPASTATYLASRCGAVHTPSQAMASIFQHHQLPKPLHFVNTLGNTASFYLTQGLGISGQTLVVAQESLSFEAALFQAVLDIQAGVVSTALVGGIDEVTLPVAQHARRLDAPQAEKLLEGSHWLLLSGNNAMASARGCRVNRPEYFSGLDPLLHWLTQQPVGDLQLCFSPSFDERQVLENTQRRLIDTSAVHRYGALEHGVYSGAALVELLQADPDKGQISIHLGRSGANYCAVRVSLDSAGS